MRASRSARTAEMNALARLFLAAFFLLHAVALAGVEAKQLEGRWLRVNSSGIGDPLEGFVLKANGRGSFVGIHSMNIAHWKLKDGKLIIATKTERHPEPDAATCEIVLEPNGTLSLRSEQGDYLDGTYRHYAE